ncbi:MAG: response regulator transcription factor [Lachnospiraceae bacterium]
MKKIMGKLAAVLGYLLILCYLLKSEWTQLFSLKMLGLFFVGTGILCLPLIGKERTLGEWQSIIGRNGLVAGYLEAFMLIFVSMNTNELMREGLLTEIGLDLRPILYGYILHIILQKEEKEEQPLKEQQEVKPPIWESEKLTRREKEVASLVAKNLSNREIAEELSISEATVKKHLTNIFEKLEIDSRSKLK